MIRVAEQLAPLLLRALRHDAADWMVVTDANVARRVWPKLRAALRCQGVVPGKPLILPVGEASKSMKIFTAIHKEFVQRGLDRRSVVVALGGGMVTDVAGFAAATYMRGIRWIAAPTTLLGMVDAAIGGKVAINLGGVKNLVGAFHQPEAVLIGTDTLQTLPVRERRGGLAEVVKYGMIADAGFFRFLENAGKDVVRAQAIVDRRIVARCARIKARVVEQDEHEGGVRAILNFGHTLGHAFEVRRQFGFSHGESVALGMLVACRIAELEGMATPEPGQRLRALLEQWGLPIRLPNQLPWAALWTSLMRDKKSLHGTPHFVLTPRIGSVRSGCIIAPARIRQAMECVQ